MFVIFARSDIPRVVYYPGKV